MSRGWDGCWDLNGAAMLYIVFISPCRSFQVDVYLMMRTISLAKLVSTFTCAYVCMNF